MAEEIDNLTLEYLRAMRGDIGAIKETLADHSHQFTVVRKQIHALEGQIHTLHGETLRFDERFDRIELRLEKIEKRLGLVEA
jgi:septal ring factor EnvC (AmiA/AmiB activator)